MLYYIEKHGPTGIVISTTSLTAKCSHYFHVLGFIINSNIYKLHY